MNFSSHEKKTVVVGVMAILFLVGTLSTFAKDAVIYPDDTWLQYETPEEAGWSSEKLSEAKEYYDKMGASAVMVVYDGAVVAAWGDITGRYRCHSVRKSLLSALYGTAVADGSIDLNKTLEELRIDDVPPLTEQEKSAKIIDLLKARSGVYHPAAYETNGMRQNRPARDSHQPGSFWFYNNWDFNALGTIYRQETNGDIFADFKSKIAEPLQMEDFRLIDGYYHYEQYSQHPAYPFRLSARDMARFGLLYLRNGSWNGKQVIPAEWVQESTTTYSKVSGQAGGGYGYMWWLADFKEVKRILGDLDGWANEDLRLIEAQGVGHQIIDILPGQKLVFIQRVNTHGGDQVSELDLRVLLNMVLNAKVAGPKVNPKLVPLGVSPTQSGIVNLPEEILGNYEGTYKLVNERDVIIQLKDSQLTMNISGLGEYSLFPRSATEFILEDDEVEVYFMLDETGRPESFRIQYKGRFDDIGLFVR